jgi:hypothetical protein
MKYGPGKFAHTVVSSSFSTLCLLSLFHRNEVNVPEKLKQALLGKRAEECPLTHKALLETPLELNLQDNIILRELHSFLEDLHAKLPTFDLRIKQGSYKVTNYLDEDEDDDGRDKSNDGEGSNRAKQKIKTVRNTSPTYKLAKWIRRTCIRGELKRRKEEKTIMDNVNLSFQPGKMYLIL